ncbi:hypothetical protein SAMN05421636_103312 [Pricia antarctica]|uniref:Uncharacterized protein n=1 Tax=Pricia antarctica TaxID=641691 RepID=A0A1G7ABF0_9FLAO|nr:hypothetical protein [Pricia antarctica]SDE12121.1 hypothetical protein SAMN05421636_103312 [Pricia antarctica]
MENRTDKEYIKEFNLGYEMAKELDLTRPMLQGQDISKEPPNSPIHEGMFQYLREVALSRNKDLDLPGDRQKLGSKEEKENKDKGRGRSR